MRYVLKWSIPHEVTRYMLVAVANPSPNVSNLRPFPKGTSGNPGGKPVGARNRLCGDFMRDIVAAWERRGPACLERLALNDPEGFVRVAAAIVGRGLVIDGAEPADMPTLIRVEFINNDQLHERRGATDQAHAVAERPPE